MMGLKTSPFTYDRADFVALGELGRPRVVGWLFRLAWALFALAAVLIAISALAGSRRELVFLIPFGLLLAIFLLLYRHGARLSGWVIGRMAGRNDLMRKQVMTVADDCFRAESSRGKTEVRWSAVPKIRETEGRLFVYLTRHQAFIVPRRAFETSEDFEAFAQAAKHHWAQHHRL
jgi:hypothetical protein